MKTYRVKKYFRWGSLQLEPSQLIDVEQSHIENCWKVTNPSTGESAIVGKKAFEIHLGLKSIEER